MDLGWLWSIGHALNDSQGMIARQLSSAMSKISVSRSIPPGISIQSGMAVPRVLSLILRWLVGVPNCTHMGSEIEANWARLLSFFNLKSISKSKQFQHVAANINRCICPGLAWIGMSVRGHGKSFSISELTFLRPKEINELR